MIYINPNEALGNILGALLLHKKRILPRKYALKKLTDTEVLWDITVYEGVMRRYNIDDYLYDSDIVDWELYPDKLKALIVIRTAEHRKTSIPEAYKHMKKHNLFRPFSLFNMAKTPEGYKYWNIWSNKDLVLENLKCIDKFKNFLGIKMKDTLLGTDVRILLTKEEIDRVYSNEQGTVPFFELPRAIQALAIVRFAEQKELTIKEAYTKIKEYKIDAESCGHTFDVGSFLTFLVTPEKFNFWKVWHYKNLYEENLRRQKSNGKKIKEVYR